MSLFSQLRLRNAVTGTRPAAAAGYGTHAARTKASGEFDGTLIWAALGLLLLGLVMVFSASLAIGEANNQPYGFVIRHAVFSLIGLVFGLIAFQVSLEQWQKLAPKLFLAGIVLLVVVLIPGIGREVNGAQRWINLGVVNFQPSELMKVFVILYAADYTVRKLDLLSTFWRGFMPMLGVMSVIGFLLLREPDFGALFVISVVSFVILFLGGLSLRLLLGLVMLGVSMFGLLIFMSPYRLERIIGFMDPWQDAFGKGYQLSHALIAFGRGEWLGVGLGGSVEKLFYLPEAHTDFLLAVLAEELGFVGVIAVIALFATIVYRAFAIGRQAVRLESYYTALVAQGVGTWLGVQAFINMGVNMGLLPTKGLTLPLMSFGGSGLMANCIALAILLRCDWELRQQLRRGGQA